MAVDPNYATTTTTPTTATITATATRPISPLPQHHYPPQAQPIRGPNHHDPSSHSHSQPFLYPVSSSGRGFIPKPLRPMDPSPLLAYSHGVRAHLDYLNHITTRQHYPHLPPSSPPIKTLPLSPHPYLKAARQSAVSDSISNGYNDTSPRERIRDGTHYVLRGRKAARQSAVSDSICDGYNDTSPRERSRDGTHYVLRGRKAAPRSAVSDNNGYKDTSTRDRSSDDSYYVIGDRKVRITEDASLYALCRSWLRNGANEENQPQQKDVMKALPKQQKDVMKALPKPLPASMVASYMSNKKEDYKHDDEHEENEESTEHLSPQDLLKKHVKRAKKVRARLREERLQRITRYRSRLRLLLPPPVEQFRNGTAAGN